jgi:hypothetical protein
MVGEGYHCVVYGPKSLFTSAIRELVGPESGSCQDLGVKHHWGMYVGCKDVRKLLSSSFSGALHKSVPALGPGQHWTCVG